MKKLKVALDIDGVVLNFMQTMTHFIKDHYGVGTLIDYCHEQHYDLSKRYDIEWMNSVGWDNVKKAFTEAGSWSRLEAMGHTSKFIALLSDPRIDVEIVTMLDPALKDQRKKNLEDLFGVVIDPAKLHCVPLTASKKPVLEEIEADVFVDDSYKHIDHCAGTHVSIWVDTESYDQGVPPRIKSDKVVSVLHLDGAVDFIFELLQKRELEMRAEELTTAPAM